jgi:hypothetical protein
MKHILCAMLTAVSTGAMWHIQWEPQSDQFAIVVITECQKNHFYAYDEFPLTAIGQEEADVRQQRTPHGERCTVRIAVLVSEDNGLTEAISNESAIVIQED